MERTAWSDKRLSDAFAQLREEMREFRAEMRTEMREFRAEMRQEFRELRREVHSELSQMKLFMLGGLITIVAAFIATNG